MILNYKSFDESIDCVKQLKELCPADSKFYIVDNDSPNESYQVLSEHFKSDEKVCVIQSGKNGGYSFGNNVGFRAAIQDGCTEILCTNNDIKFYPDSINQLSQALAAHPEVAVVGPKVYAKDGSLQMCNKTRLTPYRFMMHHKPFVHLDIFGVNKRYGMSDYHFEKDLVFEGMVSGCCFLIRSQVLEQIGYLDEGVFLYHEEDILAAKLRESGWKTMIAVNAEIMHYGSGTIGSSSPFTRFCTFSSGLYYLWNYTGISRFGLGFFRTWIVTMFRILSKKNKVYAEYAEKICQQAKQLGRTRKKNKQACKK